MNMMYSYMNITSVKWYILKDSYMTYFPKNKKLKYLHTRKDSFKDKFVFGFIF